MMQAHQELSSPHLAAEICTCVLPVSNAAFHLPDVPFQCMLAHVLMYGYPHDHQHSGIVAIVLPKGVRLRVFTRS